MRSCEAGLIPGAMQAPGAARPIPTEASWRACSTVATLKKVCWVLCVIALVLLVGAIWPLLVIWVLFGGVRDRFWLKRFRKKRAGSFYLLCSRRRGWFDFIRNNVEPVLPLNVHLIWHGKFHGPEADGDVCRLLALSDVYGVSKPVLIAVQTNRVEVRSLHAEFVPFKTTVGKDEGIARQCGQIIESAINKPPGAV